MTGTMDEILDDLEDTQKGRYLIFTVGEEDYGIAIGQVTEIIGIQEITAVPELPNYMIGIINLRGKIIPVMDMRRRFKLEPREYTNRTCIIVVNIREIAIGLIVDQVLEVLRIDDADLAPPPEVKSGFHNRYVQAIGKAGDGVKLLLNCDQLLADNELTPLEQAT
ncbi:purine-binding chemotaxis protein CheW [Hydrogenispora ethanolica]|jgi:purine-binding chemotaxis protein CheW|uniref:Purine-binding chemotaxis protein CheW n=1 Tax=Hydrogenispora ethanolica TaxID=1082276 RepID=A0A4V6NH66_HYDET|nr:chemotaxis protein CheW [Hydrogenispora ethanolica]TCL76257.1 purine-binding chemotaxis protein CheW [Hydrogenispora ethanolica]